MTQTVELNPTHLKPEEIRSQIGAIREKLDGQIQCFPRGRALMVTLLNEKGGVGKTTICLTLAAAFAIAGLRVLTIDSSLQGNLTISWGLKKRGGLYNLLIRNAPFRKVMRGVDVKRYAHQAKGELWAVPGNLETRAIMHLRPDVFLLHHKLEELRQDGFDLIIADTGPEPSDIHNMLYMATHAILFPTECAYLSLVGLADSILHKDSAAKPRRKKALADIKTLGIIPTMYRMSTDAHDIGIKQLVKRFGRMVWPPLPQRTVWEKASAVRESIFRYAPEDVAALEAWALAERTLDALKGVG